MWYLESMSLSQLGQVLVEEETGTDATGGRSAEGGGMSCVSMAVNNDSVIAYTEVVGSGSPRISITALSVKTLCFGISITHLQTGHFPFFPALDSFVVRL